MMVLFFAQSADTNGKPFRAATDEAGSSSPVAASTPGVLPVMADQGFKAVAVIRLTATEGLSPR